MGDAIWSTVTPGARLHNINICPFRLADGRTLTTIYYYPSHSCYLLYLCPLRVIQSNRLPHKKYVFSGKITIRLRIHSHVRNLSHPTISFLNFSIYHECHHPHNRHSLGPSGRNIPPQRPARRTRCPVPHRQFRAWSRSHRRRYIPLPNRLQVLSTRGVWGTPRPSRRSRNRARASRRCRDQTHVCSS